MEKDTALQPFAPKNHTLHLDNRQKAHLTGVTEVLAFDENQVVLRTESGDVALMGENLHVTQLMLEDGKMAVEGKVDSFLYTSPRKSGRLFGKRK